MNKPTYADFDPAAKFQAIQSIIASKLTKYPKAICSYSGGSDSDTMIDLIERTRAIFDLKPVKYVFFNTGLEMEATKRHVKEFSEKYGVEIETIRPKKNIVLATREHGLPFMSKVFSEFLGRLQSHGFDLAQLKELTDCQHDERVHLLEDIVLQNPGCRSAIRNLVGVGSDGSEKDLQSDISKIPYLLDFLVENPPNFKISQKCCDECKKKPAHEVQKGYKLIVTGERFAEGGARAEHSSCFNEQANGQFRLRPLFFVTDSDKAWYKEQYGLRYSDAYEVYGMKRTGCCGCSINARAVEELEIIGQYEPNLKKAAWAIFGDSYRYRQAYNDYKHKRQAEEKERRESVLTAWEPYIRGEKNEKQMDRKKSRSCL